jgi:hypothetical protein
MQERQPGLRALFTGAKLSGGQQHFVVSHAPRLGDLPCEVPEFEVEPNELDLLINSWIRLPEKSYVPVRESELPQLLQAGFADLVERIEALSGAMRRLEQRLIEVEQALACEARCRQGTLYDLGTEKYRLRQPLAVQLEEYDEEAVARIPELDVFASGTTDSEALQLLKCEVVTLYEELVATPAARLGQRPLAWLRLLNGLIEVAKPA